MYSVFCFRRVSLPKLGSGKPCILDSMSESLFRKSLLICSSLRDSLSIVSNCCFLSATLFVLSFHCKLSCVTFKYHRRKKKKKRSLVGGKKSPHKQLDYMCRDSVNSNKFPRVSNYQSINQLLEQL